MTPPDIPETVRGLMTRDDDRAKDARRHAFMQAYILARAPGLGLAYERIGTTVAREALNAWIEMERKP